jgi:putative ABC transport system permease protein
VGWFGLEIDDPDRAAEISEAVDSRFANSWAETLTETEKAFTLAFFAGSNAIIMGLNVISVLIIGVILLVLANTMAMTARERTREYSFMKTLGFRPAHLTGLIVGESLLIAMIGGTAGVGLLYLMANLVETAMANYMPIFAVPPLAVVMAAAIAIVVGLVAGIAPTVRAVRIRIVDGLRVVE